MEDIELIEELKSGDSETFRLVVEKYKKLALNYTYKFIRNRESAEDITQEVFIEVFESVRSFKVQSQLSTWIYRIAVTKSLNHIKSIKRKKRFAMVVSLFSKDKVEEYIAAPEKTNPDQELENQERAKILTWALDRLSENQRVAFTLSKYKEMSYEEISLMMNLSISSPESSLNPVVIDGVIPSLTRNTKNARLTVNDLDRKRYSGSIILDIKFYNLYSQKNDHDDQYNKITNFEQTSTQMFSFHPSESDVKTEQRTHSLQSKFKFLSTELDASFSYTKGNYSNPGYGFPITNYYTTHLTGDQLFSYADPSTLIALAGPDNPNNTYLTELDRVNNFINDNSYDIKKVDYHIPFKISDNFSEKISLGDKYHKLGFDVLPQKNKRNENRLMSA